jgi:hypothetical protein
MDSLSEAESATPSSQWLSVGYEDLVTDPKRWLGEILSFSALGDSDLFWDRVQRNAPTSARIDAYRHDLRRRDVEAMESVIGDRLLRLGYGLV